jgi:hypothetical protein
MKNWFYFIVGLIGVFSAVTHILDGLATELPVLSGSNLEYMTQAVFAFNYHIVAADHLGIGSALIVMAFQKNMAVIKSAAWVIIAINFARVLVSIITVIATLNVSDNAGTFWIPAVANTACIVLLMLGTRVKEKGNA